LTFDERDSLQPSNKLPSFPYLFCMHNYNAIAFDNGNLALYTWGNNIYNANGVMIEGAENLRATVGSNFKSNLLKFDTNKFIFIGYDACYYGQSKIDLTYNIIEPNANARGGFKVVLYDTIPRINNVSRPHFSRDDKGLIDVILEDTVNLFLYHINKNGLLEKKDSFYYPVAKIVPPPFNQTIPFV